MMECFDFTTSVCVLKVCLATGVELEFPLCIEERDRLKSCLGTTSKGYAVFTSEDLSVALNTRAIAYSQFIHLGPALVHQVDEQVAEEKLKESEHASEEKRDQLVVHVLNRAEPVIFDIEPDEVDMDEDMERANIQYLFLNLDGFDHEDGDICHFVDEDGDEVMINPAFCAAIIAPLRCVEPALYEAEGEGLSEDEEEREAA
jgi:hypothetical protein